MHSIIFLAPGTGIIDQARFNNKSDTHVWTGLWAMFESIECLCIVYLGGSSWRDSNINDPGYPIQGGSEIGFFIWYYNLEEENIKT